MAHVNTLYMHQHMLRASLRFLLWYTHMKQKWHGETWTPRSLKCLYCCSYDCCCCCYTCCHQSHVCTLQIIKLAPVANACKYCSLSNTHAADTRAHIHCTEHWTYSLFLSLHLIHQSASLLKQENSLLIIRQSLYVCVYAVWIHQNIIQRKGIYLLLYL